MNLSELNELEILNIITKFKSTKFLGVFACDEIENIRNEGCLIVNTDPSYQKGTHWISVIIYHNNIF